MTRRLACVLTTVALAVPAPASADDLAMAGAGTVSPGIPTFGCQASPSYSFTADAVSPPAAFGTVHFDGSGASCESLGAGSGSGSFSGATTCRSVTFTRTFVEMRFTGVGCSLVCHLVPTSLNPWTTYEVTCTPAVTLR